MKKIILGISGIIILGIFSFVFIQNYSLAKVGERLAIKKGVIKFPQKYEFYKTIKCNYFDLIKPQYAFVNKWKTRDNYEIMFYNVDYDLFSQNYKFNYIGGTDVQNTTFPELLKMVKEDCYQFQKTFYQGDDNKLWWTYTKAFKNTKTKEEIEREKREEEEYERKVKSGEIKEDTRSIEEIMKGIE